MIISNCRVTASMLFRCAIYCLLVAHGVSAEAVTIANSGFEETGSTGQPVHWITGADASGKMTIGVDEQMAHGGKRSLRLHRGPAEGADQKVLHAGFYQMIAVEPERYYLVSCWMKARDARGWPGARLYSEFLGEMQAGPDHTGDYDWKPVSLCVYSKSARAIPIAGYAYLYAGSVWFDDLTVREIAPEELGDCTPEESSSWKPSPEDSRRGYVVFTRPTTERVYHTALPRPGEVTQELRSWGARDQTVSGNLLVHSLEDLTEVRLIPGDLRSGRRRIPSANLACRVVEPYRYKLDNYRWMLIPLFLRQRPHFALPAKETAQVYVTIRIPLTAAPGDYEGLLTIRPKDSPAMQVKMRLTVLPLTLERPHAAFFQYYANCYIYPPYSTPRYHGLYMKNMRDHGFTSFTIYNHCEVPDGKGGWNVDVGRQADGDPMSLADTMKLGREVGLPAPNTPIVYLNSYGGKDHPDWRHDFGAFLGGTKSVAALEDERKRRGWPEFLYYMIDEPGDEKRNTAARGIYDKIYRDLPVRTVTAIGQPGIDRVGDLYKVWIASWGDMSDRLIREARERRRELWTYECWSMAQLPEMARYFGGFWSYRCGVKGNGDWVYISTARGRDGSTLYPRLNEKGEYVDTDNWVFGYVLPGPDGPIDTLGLELRREGIDDFRYCELLDRLLKEKSRSRDPGTKAAITRARAVRDAALRRFRPDAFSNMAGGYVWLHDYRPQPELRLSDYDHLRHSLAEACVALTDCEKGNVRRKGSD